MEGRACPVPGASVAAGNVRPDSILPHVRVRKEWEDKNIGKHKSFRIILLQRVVALVATTGRLGNEVDTEDIFVTFTDALGSSRLGAFVSENTSLGT